MRNTHFATLLGERQTLKFPSTILELTEPEALADFLLRGSASASGSIDVHLRLN